MARVRVGFAGVYRPLFKGDKLKVYAQSAEALRALGQKLDFETHTAEKPASNLEEAQAVARQMQEADADLVLLQMSSFCGGEALAPFAAQTVPLGLWAVPETSESGPLPLNSLCGLNLYASLLRRPFKWFYGRPEDEMFSERLRVTIQALRAKGALSRARIGLIGGHAPGFDNLKADRELLAARLGVKTFEHPIEELFAEAGAVTAADADAQAGDMRRRSASCTAPDAHIVEVARFQIALRNIAAKGRYDGLAVRCWPEVPERAGVMICAAMGGASDNLPAACEGDVLGAAGMIALKAMSGAAPMLADLSHTDERDQSVLMWHCGNSPACWADDGGTRLERHFNRDTMGAVRSMVFRAGRATAFQLSANGSVGFVFTGSFLGAKKTGFDGSRGWLGELRMDGAPMPVRDLLNTIFTNRLPHHFPIGAGDLSEEVAELCRWLGINIVNRIPYRAAMQAGRTEEAS